jgi:FAD:protein FMN transferase
VADRIQSVLNRRQCLRLSLGVGALGFQAQADAGSLQSATPTLFWRERRMQALGTHLRLLAGHETQATLEQALDAAVSAVQLVERQMSLFDDNSAVCQLNRTGELTNPPAILVQILTLAQAVAQRSRGAFDITVQPYWLAWQAAQQEGRLARAAELAQARTHVGWRGLQVAADRIRLLRPGMGITLNGIAQGFAGDLARAALQKMGVRHALLDTGEWTALGHAPQDQAWALGVGDPRSATRLLARIRIPEHSTRQAVATSSDANYRFGADDRHHHIFDPSTGYSPSGLASVTVLAGSGAMADALTKVMFMGTMQNAMALARHWNVDVLAVAKTGAWQATGGLASYLEK